MIVPDAFTPVSPDQDDVAEHVRTLAEREARLERAARKGAEGMLVRDGSDSRPHRARVDRGREAIDGLEDLVNAVDLLQFCNQLTHRGTERGVAAAVDQHRIEAQLEWTQH